MSLNLIAKEDFIGFINIEFTGLSDELFSTYADQLDEQMLTKLFGKLMYDDIVANPATVPNKYLIDNFLKSMQKGFFYFYFNTDRESFSTTLGEFEADVENATKDGSSRNIKLVKNYNVGVKWYKEAYEYVNENLSDYPLYDETEPITEINIFGI